MILAGDYIPKDLSVRLPDEFAGKLVLANLEGPVCDDGLAKSNKVGVCLHTHREKFRVQGLAFRDEKKIRFAFSLANNHIMDYGEEGLRQTMETLDALGIPHAGADGDEEAARRPMILEENGKRIAVYCCCERQFGMATGKGESSEFRVQSAGVAGKGVWLYEAIRSVKASEQADFVIVSCHAASEFSPWVSPVLHDFYHSLVDAGADVIHGHHAHVPQGYEVYKGKPIFYGLGNFVVDSKEWSCNPNQLWSIVSEVKFGDDGVSWRTQPYRGVCQDNKINILETEGCLDYITAANAQFVSKSTLEAFWQESACRLFMHLYGSRLPFPSVVTSRVALRTRLRFIFWGVSNFIRALRVWDRPNRKSVFYGKVIYTAFNCESHAESIRTSLGVFLKLSPDLRTDETRRLAQVCGM